MLAVTSYQDTLELLIDLFVYLFKCPFEMLTDHFQSFTVLSCAIGEFLV